MLTVREMTPGDRPWWRELRLALAVIRGNDTAIAVYRRHGFREAPERGSLLPDESAEQIMTKTLP